MFLFNQNNNPVQDDGSGKFSQIQEKLCAKRLQLEKSMHESPNKDTQDELNLLRSSMKTFGITEIDYAAYEAKQKRQ